MKYTLQWLHYMSNSSYMEMVHIRLYIAEQIRQKCKDMQLVHDNKWSIELELVHMMCTIEFVDCRCNMKKPSMEMVQILTSSFQFLLDKSKVGLQMVRSMWSKEQQLECILDMSGLLLSRSSKRNMEMVKMLPRMSKFLRQKNRVEQLVSRSAHSIKLEMAHM